MAILLSLSLSQGRVQKKKKKSGIFQIWSDPPTPPALYPPYQRLLNPIHVYGFRIKPIWCWVDRPYPGDSKKV